MNAATPWDRLLAAAGVATHNTDGRGKQRAVSIETQRALLAAMDFPSETPEQIEDSLARLDRGDGKPLPTTVILHETESGLSIPLSSSATSIPVEWGDAMRRWNDALRRRHPARSDPACLAAGLSRSVDPVARWEGHARHPPPTDRGARALLYTAVDCGQQPPLGHRGPTLCFAVGAQLGNRRFHRPDRAPAHGRPLGRGMRRAQSASRALSRQSRAGQPLFAQQPDLP